MIVDLVVEDRRANEEDVKLALREGVRIPATMTLQSGGTATVRQMGVGGVREGILPEQQAEATG